MSDVIAYTYEADYHCPSCAYERFGESLDDADTKDNEGNPIWAVPSWDDKPIYGIYCGDCHEEIVPPVKAWVEKWFERDVLASMTVYIGREDGINHHSVKEWDTEEMLEAVEEGTLDPANWDQSALEYCQDMGLLKWNGEDIEI